MAKRTSGIAVAIAVGTAAVAIAASGATIIKRRRATDPTIRVDPVLDGPPSQTSTLPWEPAVERGRRAARKHQLGDAARS